MLTICNYLSRLTRQPNPQQLSDLVGLRLIDYRAIPGFIWLAQFMKNCNPQNNHIIL